MSYAEEVKPKEPIRKEEGYSSSYESTYHVLPVSKNDIILSAGDSRSELGCGATYRPICGVRPFSSSCTQSHVPHSHEKYHQVLEANSSDASNMETTSASSKGRPHTGQVCAASAKTKEKLNEHKEVNLT